MAMLIAAVLTVIITNIVIYTESAPDNCISKWNLDIDGLSENETVVEYSQKVDPKTNVRTAWHWKSKNDGGKWTSTYIKTLNRVSQHGTFFYSNTLTNHSARLRWEMSPESFSWKTLGDRVLYQPAWNITVCDSIQWGFVPAVGGSASWSFRVGNKLINSGDKHNKKTVTESTKKVSNREKRQTSGTNPRNIFEWLNGVVNDIFGTGRNNRNTNKCTLIINWLNGLFNIGRPNTSSTTTTTENPDSEYLDSFRRRDVETVTQSRNKRPRVKPKRISEEYYYY